MIAVLAYAVIFAVIFAVIAIGYASLPRRAALPSAPRPKAAPTPVRLPCRHPDCSRTYASTSSRNRHERSHRVDWEVYNPAAHAGSGR